MAGTPPNYHFMHLDTQAYILSGENSVVTAGTDPYDGTYTVGTGGIKSELELLQEDIHNPYSFVIPYNPYNISEPLYQLMAFMWHMEKDARRDMKRKDKWLDSLTLTSDGKVVNPSETWPDYFSTADTAIQDSFGDTYLDDRVDTYEVQENSRVLINSGQMNNRLSSLGGANSTARAVAIVLMEVDKERSVAQFRSQLYVEAMKQRIDLTVDAANKMLAAEVEGAKLNLELEAMFLRSSVQFVQQVGTMIQATDLYIRSQRTYIADKVMVQTESKLWDIKLYDYMQRGLSSISGTAVIPEQPNKFMETLSTGASVIGSLGPLFSMLA